jgi:hypothetical protein
MPLVTSEYLTFDPNQIWFVPGDLTISAVAPATASIKSQDPAALERRLKRLRTNADHQLLCRAKDTKIAELEKYVREGRLDGSRPSLPRVHTCPPR